MVAQRRRVARPALPDDMRQPLLFPGVTLPLPALIPTPAAPPRKPGKPGKPKPLVPDAARLALAQIPARARPGDLWRLGVHRLVVGDARDGALVARLFADAPATIRMLWTDPPYGVGYVGGSQDPRDPRYRAGRPVPNDTLGQVGTGALIREALLLASSYCAPGASAYIASPAGDNLPVFIAAMTAAGFPFRHSLVWVKNQMIFGRSDYHYKHELVLYGWRKGAHLWAGDRKQRTVFEVARPRKSPEHPTMKPLDLIAPMVTNSSHPGDVVYDPFAGSGSTLLACERLGRACYSVELAPHFADVILTRYERETGQRARLLERPDAPDVEYHDEYDEEEAAV